MADESDANERNAHSISVPRDVAQLRAVRDWLRDEVAPWVAGRPDAGEEVAVMANELLTNAIRHTTSIPILTVLVADDRIRVSVHDDDPNPPVVMPVDVQRPSGNGMRIVEAWAERWGTDRVPGNGKHVWFTVCS